MNPFDWIVFDSTGTLMIPSPEAAEVYAAVSSRYGAEATIDDVRTRLKAAIHRHFFEGNEGSGTNQNHERERWKKIVRDSVGLAGATLDLAFAELWRHFASAQHWRLYDDVELTIKRLRGKGYRIAVASNFDERLTAILQEMQIEDWFDAVLISAELGWSKPNTKFYDAATERLGATERNRLLMIGDTERGDVLAAKQAGWQARHLIRAGDESLSQLVADL
ncbi:MAG: HAD-IA family hydrolase [Planctomycetota bacterium]